MKALFAHELKFLRDRDGRYYLRGYNREYWQRYLKFFDELYIIGRVTDQDAVEGLDVISDVRIHVVEVPSIYQLSDRKENGQKTGKIIGELVKSCDFVIARQPGGYAAYAIGYCKALGVPYLIEMVGCPWDSLWNHSWKGKILAPKAALDTRKIVKDAPYVIYVTEQFLQRRYPTNGLSTNCSNVTLEPVDEALLDRRMEHIAVKTPGLEIGTVGAVDVRYKGQQFVIEALAALKRKGRNDFTYHLVGGGDQGFLRAEAKRCGVQDQVVFHGSLTHDDVFSFLDTIDVYVQPSLQEGLPRSLIEAMSRGLLCLGAATGGIPELLEDRYVFRKRASGGIARILAGITEDDLCAQATRNFEEAKKYQLELIEQRRDIMFARAIEESYKGKTET